MRHRRGVGFGSAFAIIVLTILFLSGTFFIVRTYTTAQTALENYAESVQKPDIEVLNYTVRDNQITVTLLNKGPGSAIIENVKIYKEDRSGVPISTVLASQPQFPISLPVGGRLPVTFQVDNISDYIFWNKPIRIVVVTSKGTLNLAYPQMTGVIYVNIHLPSWADSVSPNIANNLQLYVSASNYMSPAISLGQALSVTCENPIVSPPQQFFKYKLCSEGNTIVAVLEAIAGIEYTIQLKGSVRVPVVAFPSVSQLGPNTFPDFYFSTKTISYTSVASVAPGASTEVTFKLSELLYENRAGRTINFGDTQSSWVIDFSWLYAETQRQTTISVGSGTNENSLSRERLVATLAGRILYTGVVSILNPYGCDVYPLPLRNTEIHPPLPSGAREGMRIAYISEPYSGGRTYSKTTGLPIVINDFPNSCDRRPTSWSEILRVNVKVPLRTGYYLVIPVFSYNDDDGLSNNARIIARMYDTYGRAIASAQVIERGEPTTLQVSAPLSVTATRSGVYTLSLSLYMYGISSASYVGIYLSKIVVIPMAGSSGICLYDVNTTPYYPWVYIDTSTGFIGRYSVADLVSVYMPRTYKASYNEAWYEIPDNGQWNEVLTYSNWGYSSTIYFNNTPLSAWTYVNYLPQVVNISATITDGDNRLIGALSSVAVYELSRIRSPYSTLSQVATNISNIMNMGYTFVTHAEYYYADSDPNNPDKRVQVKVEIRTPNSYRNYYIFIPYYFYADGGVYLEPPSITVDGGIPIMGDTPSSQPLGTGELLVIQASGYRTVTVTFTLPTPESGSQSATGTVASYLGIGSIAVTDDPSYFLNFYSRTNRFHSFGSIDNTLIYVLNVEPIDPVAPVYITVYDEDGGVVKRYQVSSSSMFNVRIAIDELFGYAGFEYWTYPFRNLYVVVENANCIMSGQTDSTGSLLGN